MNQRISNLRNKMKAQNLKAVLINNLKNVYYLTNFWGSNGTALVTEERVVLFTDSRYTIHAHATCFPFVEIVETRDELTAAAEIVKDLGIKELGFEDEVTVAYHARMASVFNSITLQSLANFVMELRLIKDETEIAAIKKACSISDQAFHDILDYIKEGKRQSWKQRLSSILECGSWELLVYLLILSQQLVNALPCLTRLQVIGSFQQEMP